MFARFQSIRSVFRSSRNKLACRADINPVGARCLYGMIGLSYGYGLQISGVRNAILLEVFRNLE